MGGGGFGVSATPGIDFHETFSPVVKSTTIRAVLSLAVTNDWPLRQLDIQNAFLYGNLKEQVYMNNLRFIRSTTTNHGNFAHNLLRLKSEPPRLVERSPRLTSISFQRLAKRIHLLLLFASEHTFVQSGIVDDIIVTVIIRAQSTIICQLGSAFTLKDIGPLNYFLGIEIVPHVSGILLSQKMYILELLQSAGLSNCNHVSSPMVTSSSLSLDV
ncbi:copia protein [Tanacetum coccineum]